MRPVTDQDPHRHALVLERALLGGADAVQHVYLVRPPSPPRPPSRGGAEPEGPLAQTRDEMEIVGAEHGTRLALGGALEQPPGEHGVGGVHIALFRKRHVRRLVVGALHEPDGGREREQCLQVGRRAAQVGLQAYADTRVGGANGLEQLQRCVHVARLLHVDPEKGPGSGGPCRERQQVLEARFGIQVETEVGELDGDFRGQLPLPDFLEHAQVVIAYGGGLVAARDLLAELGEHAADAVPGEVCGRGERRAELLPGHESARGAAEGRALGQLPGKPGAAGRAQQQATGERHRRRRDSGANDRRYHAAVHRRRSPRRARRHRARRSVRGVSGTPGLDH